MAGNVEERLKHVEKQNEALSKNLQEMHKALAPLAKAVHGLTLKICRVEGVAADLRAEVKRLKGKPRLHIVGDDE